MELDKRKPYGTISGTLDGFAGARYMQDGNYFMADGSMIGEKTAQPIKEQPSTGEIGVGVPYSAEDEPVAAEPEPFNVLSLLDKTIPEIVAALPGLSDDEIVELYLAEIDGKTRSGLIKAIDEHRASAGV